MSVVSSAKPQSGRWKHLWPLALFLIVSMASLYALWQYWPQLLLNSAGWQKSINQQLSSLLRQVAEDPARAGWSLLSFSFIYGVLHALGPGHGKIVISTWLATHPTRLKNSLKLTFAASLLQGLVAIALVVIVLGILQLPSRQLHMSSFWLEKGSYALVGILGVMLAVRAVRQLEKVLRKPGKFTAFTPHIIHNADCGCGHQHLPTEQQLAAGEDWRARAAIVLSMGMRPCSGAIMVLLFSKVIGVFSWGIGSVLAMAAGTSITISGLALLVHSFRQFAVRLSGNKAPVLWRQVGWATLALAGSVILIVAAVVMWLSAQPAVRGIRPF